MSVLLALLSVPLVAGAAAAGAIAVPVLVHLLSRRQEQIVPWAATRFLLAAQARRRRRVDRWLLLAMRTLALLMILAALCAATPWAERLWQSIAPGAGRLVVRSDRTHHLLVLDASLSSRADSAEGRAWDRIRREAIGFVDAAGAGDAFSLVILRNTAEVIVPGPALEASRIRSEIEQLQPTDATGDGASVLPIVRDILNRSPATYQRRQVLIFTDSQVTTWGPTLLPAESPGKPDPWQPITARADVVIWNVGQATAPNLAVTELRLLEPMALLDGTTTVFAQIQNWGSDDVRDVRVELTLGRPTDRAELPPLAVEQRLIERIPAGQTVGLTFPFEGANRLRDAGLHRVELRILRPDPLLEDNTRTLILPVRSAVQVMVVNGVGGSESLRRAAGYLVEALDPGRRRGAGNPIRPVELSLAEFTDPTLGDLANVDVLVLADVGLLATGPLQRIEQFLRRGGGLILGFGPNSATVLPQMQAQLGPEGIGILPAQLQELTANGETAELGYRLVLEEEAYRQAPFREFRDPNARAGLTAVPFRRAVRLVPADDGRVRVLARLAAARGTGRAEAALVEWPCYRGRVLLWASSWNTDWTDWPLLPSYLPFVHELVRYAAAVTNRHMLRVGDSIEEPLPAAMVGLEAKLRRPDGGTETSAIVAEGDGGVVRFAAPMQAGVYRLQPPAGAAPILVAVNATPSGESDLRSVPANEWSRVANAQVVRTITEIRESRTGEAVVVREPEPQGPRMARWLATIALGIWLAELALAGRSGPSRRGGRALPRVRAGWRSATVRLLIVLIPLGLATALLVGLGLLQAGFIPDAWIPGLAGLPASEPGEAVRWQVDGTPTFLGSALADSTLRFALFGGAALLAVLIYLWERRAAGSFAAVVVPLILRLLALALLTGIIWPQLRLEVTREGWPDIVILLDTSASMAHSDGPTSRLEQAQKLLREPDRGWLETLLRDKKSRVHLMTLAEQTETRQEIRTSDDLAAAQQLLQTVQADGNQSRIGDAVETVVQQFRGRALTAIVLLSDGIVTEGSDLASAGRTAGRAGVPLFTVTLGNYTEPPDAILADLKAEPLAIQGDEVALEARLAVRGTGWPSSLPVILQERIGNRLEERSRIQVPVDPAGAPAPVRLTTVVKEPGRKTFVLTVPPRPGEADTANNRLEHSLEVQEARRLRLLLIDSSPRYEFRFLKTLWERGTELAGTRSVELSTILLDAGEGFAELDQSSRKTLPTRQELLDYDAVVLGDVDPAHPRWPRMNAFLADLGEFVRVKGGGLLIIAGERFLTPLMTSPVAELLPVLPAEMGQRETQARCHRFSRHGRAWHRGASLDQAKARGASDRR